MGLMSVVLEDSREMLGCCKGDVGRGGDGHSTRRPRFGRIVV